MIAVVHLVWGPLGQAPVRRFLESYSAHPAGVEHELVVVLNGVEGDQRSALKAELDAVAHRTIELHKPVQDLAAYAQAVARLEHERVCFLNSYSAILVSGWLAKLAHALEQPRVGLVGATGSWASVRSATLNGLFLPNPYRGVVPPRRVARDQLAAIELELDRHQGDAPPPPRRSLTRSVRATLATLPRMPEQLVCFDGFPAAHVRTNAFMIERTTFLALRIGRIRRKMDAYRLENGRHSITRQVRAFGLSSLIVDREGRFFDERDWPESRTLWQGDQEGLMIADNQTRIYANGGLDRRRLLSTFAWGRAAAPTCPVQGGLSRPACRT